MHGHELPFFEPAAQARQRRGVSHAHVLRGQRGGLRRVASGRFIDIAHGAAGQQFLRVRVLRGGKQRGGAALLHQAALLHDGHAVGKAAHQVQVVRDHQHGHAVFAPQALQQIQNLPAQAHIQRRGRLIGQQKARLAGQRHRNHGALALPARELVRESARTPLRLGNARFRQQLNRLLRRAASGQAALEAQGLGHLRADGHQRIERRHRLLKNHGDFIAAQRAHLPLGQRQQVARLPVAPGKQRPPLQGRAIEQPQQAERRQRFARA